MLVAEGTYGRIYTVRKGVVMKKYKNEHFGISGDFIREVSALKSVKSPYVIEILDINEDSIELPYYEKSLHHAIKENYPLNAKELLKTICFGIYELHCVGILHCDVKPGNIMLKDEKTACIIDTGFSKILEIDRNYGHRDMKIMTFYYRAPEVFLQEKYGFEVDIWSIGCTFVEILEGKTLFEIRNEDEIICEQFRLMGTPSYVCDDVRFLGEYREKFYKYGEEVVKLIGGMLNTDFKERYFLFEILKCLGEDVGNERLKYGDYLDEYIVGFQLDKLSDKMKVMRKILLLWLINMVDYFELHDAVYFRMVVLIDKLLSGSVLGKVYINEKNFQLIGLVCLFISSKYEMSNCLTIHDILSVCDYSRSDLLDMEKRVIRHLGWNVSFPTLYNYLSLYSYDLTLNKQEIKIFLKSLYICTIYYQLYEWDYSIIAIVLGYIITKKKLEKNSEPLNTLKEEEQESLLKCKEFLLSMEEFDEIKNLRSLL